MRIHLSQSYYALEWYNNYKGQRMKFISSFKVEAEYKVSSGIDKVEYRAIELVSRIYKYKFDYTVKVGDIKKTVNKKDNTSVIRIADISLVFVNGVITEVQPANAPEAKEVIKEIKVKSNFIANTL